ncbi:very long chain fatty acid elongase AAEL008004-like [Periplaneta americana]|uniref:very long chain fatty acid elongase AAEL008004-like n=1 Tax=Periplaneta americana TaxID=6978 RepID=UPI0037E96FB6
MSTLNYTRLMQQYDELIKINKHTEVESWPLLGGPVPLFSILGIYLLFVLKVGPNLMAKRQPFGLQSLLVVYNFFLVLVSLFLTVLPFINGIFAHMYNEGHCNERHHPSLEVLYKMTSYGWWYMASKIIELADTVFFVLRKKKRQISFLHVFHHTSVSLIVWFIMKYLPGQQAVIFSFLNSFVHVFMYAYYMLAAMGPRFQKYLWWKKYMTRIQLVQFCVVFIYTSSLLLFDCNQPKAVSVYFLCISVMFLLMFLNFYSNEYKKVKV